MAKKVAKKPKKVAKAKKVTKKASPIKKVTTKVKETFQEESKYIGKGLSIAALVLSLLFFIPVLPLVGLILGIMALVRIRKVPKFQEGRSLNKGLAIAAVVIGGFFSLIGLTTTLGSISLYNEIMSSRENFDYAEPDGFVKGDMGLIILYMDEANDDTTIVIMPPAQATPHDELWKEMKEGDADSCDSVEFAMNKDISYNGMPAERMVTSCKQGGKDLIIDRVSFIKGEDQVGFSLNTPLGEYDKNLNTFEVMLNSVDWK